MKLFILNHQLSVGAALESTSTSDPVFIRKVATGFVFYFFY